MNKKTIVTILLLTITITVTFTTLLPPVNAANVEITSVEPSTHHGKVGEEIHITGTINTTGGLYLIWFGNDNVINGTASQERVDISFPIPLLPTKNYTITLQDDTTENNATTWFQIDTGFFVEPKIPIGPELLREGESVVLNVTVTGGQLNTVFYANITVRLPSPLSTNFSAVVGLTNTTNTGYGNATLVYPNETMFTGSSTNYTGSYHVYFNLTQSLAENEFFIGLTNSSQYHREDFVEIRAIGYQENETATISITYPNTTLHSESVNASSEGIINMTWPVPLDAPIGDYNITINSTTTRKAVSDTQVFSVPGYPIEVYTRNLVGDVVSDILVEALDKATNTKFENTSDSNGLASFHLEKGDHTLTAFWKNVTVAEMPVTIWITYTYNLPCRLTNMKVTVMDKNGILMPFINLNISFQYVTTKEGRIENESKTGKTDIFGVFFLNSTLSNVNYTIDASRNGIVFNVNNNTVENLPPDPWYNVTIICPAKTLTLKITEHHGNPLPNALVEMIEQMGGLSYSSITDDSGMATVECTIGNYTVRVYADNVLLNETFVQVFNDTQREIYCQLYNLTVSIKVVDYFGQPIPNAKVTWQGNGLQDSGTTGSGGIVTFSNIIGGDLQVTVCLPGQSQPCIVTTSYVDNSTTIGIKIEKYVMLVGFLVETSQLTTAIIIAVTVIFLLSLEVSRRKRLKPQKSES